jgi:hypothetical protein
MTPNISKENEFEFAGLKCWIRSNFEHKNGYVAIDKTHPLFGQHYDSSKFCVSVHGGLTYSGQDGDDLWVFGFDTAHAGDFWPEEELSEITDPELIKIRNILRHPALNPANDYGKKWTTADLIMEIKHLATQLRELAAS